MEVQVGKRYKVVKGRLVFDVLEIKNGVVTYKDVEFGKIWFYGFDALKHCMIEEVK